jgi:hypothetical protein
MSWDPWVQEEIRGLRDNQERRAYEAHLRRNPDEQARIDEVVFRARVRQIKKAKAFNEFVPEAEAAKQAVAEIRQRIRIVTHNGLYKCKEGAVLGGLFSARAAGDPVLAWIFRVFAILILLAATAATAATAANAGLGFVAVLTGSCFSLYVIIIASCKKIELVDIMRMNAELSKLRSELLRRKNVLKAANAKRVDLYKACVVSRNPWHDALNTLRIEHETLPGFIMKKYE